MTAVHRVADIVLEPDSDDPTVLWVAPVPDGPAARLDGVGPLIVELLIERPRSAEDLLQEMRTILGEIPADAGDTVRAFLDSLLAAGILTTQETA